MMSLLLRAESGHPLERVTPLVPPDLAGVSRRSGKNALVEASSRRCFGDALYHEVGAGIVPPGSRGDVMIGIRNLKPSTGSAGAVHMAFIQASAGNPERMAALRELLDAGSTVIDIDGIADAQGKRLVGFGPFDGHAGALDLAWLLGRRWASRGLITPLAHCRQATDFADLAAARSEFRRIGRTIADKGFPRDLSPVTIGILGRGAAAGSFREVMEDWPVEFVEPAALSLLCRRGGGDPRKIYLIPFEERHLVERLDGRGFDYRDYIVQPWLYRSRFDTYLPWLTAAVNAISWNSRYPRFVSWSSLAALVSRPGPLKLEALVDLPGEKEGALECAVRTTSEEQPAYRCDPAGRSIADGLEGEGILVMANPEIHGELPVDVSVHVSKALKPFLPQVMLADFSSGLERSGLSDEVRRGVIACRGELTDAYTYLSALMDRSGSPAS